MATKWYEHPYHDRIEDVGEDGHPYLTAEGEVVQKPDSPCLACGCTTINDCGGPSNVDGMDLGACGHIDEEGEMTC